MTLSYKAGPGPGILSPILLFDMGNILVKLNTAAGLWGGNPPAVDESYFEQRWSQSTAIRDFETGRILDFHEFYRQVRPQLGTRLAEEDFRVAYDDIIGEPFAETHAMLQALHGDFPLMVLSNTSNAHWQKCDEVHGIAKYFKQLYLSYELGLMKPDLRIYQAVLEQAGVDPQTIYFFDDRPENVSAAASIGINAHLSMGGKPIIDALRAYGFIL